MADAADQVAAADERAMEIFEQQRLARIEESHRPNGPEADRRCADCGELIGLARQKLNPRTGRCTPCATAVEQRGFA